MVYLLSLTKQVLLGIKSDQELKFDEHVNYLCKKADQKLNALNALFMNINKNRNIMKAFIEPQLGYCPLIWIFHSRGLNHKINRTHERALRITFSDKWLPFSELLNKDNSITIHYRNIRAVAIETNKVIQVDSPPLLNEMFVPLQCIYGLRGNRDEELSQGDMVQSLCHFWLLK